MKKIIIGISLIIGVSIFCCANFIKCNNNIPVKTTIQFASWGSESETKILKNVLDDFEKENPKIKVDFMHIPQNYFQKIHLLFASNTSPDVLFINNQYLPVYANAGVLEDLTPYYDSFEYNKFYDKSIQTLSWQNKNYAVPRDVSNLVIFYNKDIFKKYNVTLPKKNWTLNEFLGKAGKLTHSPEIFGVSFEDEPLFFFPYLTSYGVTDFTNFEDENFQNGLKFYADLRNKYHFAPYKKEAASATMAQMFLQGKLAMYLSGRWMVPKFREEAKFDWDVIEFPCGQNNCSVPMDASGWAISKNSTHKDEAVKLVKYLSSKESSEKFTRSGLIVPARIDVASTSVFLDSQKPKNAKIFLSAIKNSNPTPVTVNFREVIDDMKIKTEYLFNKK